MKELILVRGLPGSGKTTLAHLIAGSDMTDWVVSADDYFTYGGEYQFDRSKLKQAHAYCRDMVSIHMTQSTPRIVVANTFTQEWEMKPYFELAEEYGYRVHTIITENRHGSTNVHNVPEESLRAMHNRFEVAL